MPSYLTPVIFVAGVAMLIKGADWLVEGGSSLAKRFGMSELMIGLTIVSFGTSMPELLVNIIASIQENADIAIGNIVGSNIANVFLVLGASAAISPLSVKTSTVWKEIPFSLLAGLVLFLLVNERIVDGVQAAPSALMRSEGIILMLFFILFLYYTFGLKREEISDDNYDGRSLTSALSLVLLGCAILPIGGKLVVDAAEVIAHLFGVSESLIGLSVVAVGTSLPEAATSITAAWKGKADIAVGNVVGSNIFNIFWILGISAIIHPISFSSAVNFDLLVVIASAALLFYLVHTGPIHHRFFLFWKQRQEHILIRREGWFLLLCYACYLGYIVWRG